MMGAKIRNFAPLPDLSLEELVPKDNFYRRLEATLDLSFVRELVKDCYFTELPTRCEPVEKVAAGPIGVPNRAQNTRKRRYRHSNRGQKRVSRSFSTSSHLLGTWVNRAVTGRVDSGSPGAYTAE